MVWICWNRSTLSRRRMTDGRCHLIGDEQKPHTTNEATGDDRRRRPWPPTSSSPLACSSAATNTDVDPTHNISLCILSTCILGNQYDLEFGVGARRADVCVEYIKWRYDYFVHMIDKYLRLSVHRWIVSHRASTSNINTSYPIISYHLFLFQFNHRRSSSTMALV